MVPGRMIGIVVGSLERHIIELVKEQGVQVLEYESQETQTENLARRVLDVQTQQTRKGSGKETRPPWIRKATGRAPRYLGPKGPQR